MGSSDYPESGVKLVVENDDFNSAMDDAISRLEDFESYGDVSVSIDVTADTSDLEAELPADGETIGINVDVDQTGDTLDDLPLDNTTVDYTINEEVETSAETDKTLSALETLKNLTVLKTIWTIAGNAVDLLGSLKTFAVDPLIQIDNAVARINATTGRTIPNAQKLIKDIFFDDLGESVDQVAGLVSKAAQLKVPIDEATRAALTFTHTFKNEDPNQVMDTLNAMVKNHLSPNFKEATDLLVTGFQNGANKGGDLLTTLEKNSGTLHDLGMNGQQALSFIKSGLDKGYTSAQELVNTLSKIKINVQKAAGNSKSNVSETLEKLGIANPVEAGKEWSGDFFAQVITSIQNAPVSDSQKQAMFSNLVGGKLSAKDFTAFMTMDPSDAAAVFANVTGAADNAAQEIDNSLGGAIDDFELAVQKAAVDFLSSKQIDLPGKMDALKTGLQNALDVLAQGGTLSDAFTIALKPLGFDDDFGRLEAALGNFVIGILQAVAIAQDIAGQGKAAEATRGTVAKLGAQQLAFNLTVDNPQDVANDIESAISQGVKPEQIADLASQAVQKLIETGAPEAAQALVDALSAKINPNEDLQLTPSGSPINVEPTLPPDAIANLQKQIDDAKPVTVTPVVDKDGTDAFLDSILPVADATDNLKAKTAAAGPPTATVATNVQKMGTSATAAAPNINNAAGATSNLSNQTDRLADNADDAADSLGSASDDMGTLATNATILGPALEAVNTAIAHIITTAMQIGAAANAVNNAANNNNPPATGGSNGNTTPTPNSAGGQFMGTGIVGDHGPEIVSNNRGLSVLNNKTTSAIMAALQNFIPGHVFAGSGGNTYIVNNNNNVQSEAQADTLGYKTASTIRGMSGG